MPKFFMYYLILWGIFAIAGLIRFLLKQKIKIPEELSPVVILFSAHPTRSWQRKIYIALIVLLMVSICISNWFACIIGVRNIEKETDGVYCYYVYCVEYSDDDPSYEHQYIAPAKIKKQGNLYYLQRVMIDNIKDKFLNNVSIDLDDVGNDVHVGNKYYGFKLLNEHAYDPTIKEERNVPASDIIVAIVSMALLIFDFIMIEKYLRSQLKETCPEKKNDESQQESKEFDKSTTTEGRSSYTNSASSYYLTIEPDGTRKVMVSQLQRAVEEAEKCSPSNQTERFTYLHYDKDGNPVVSTSAISSKPKKSLEEYNEHYKQVVEKLAELEKEKQNKDKKL